MPARTHCEREGRGQRKQLAAHTLLYRVAQCFTGVLMFSCFLLAQGARPNPRPNATPPPSPPEPSTYDQNRIKFESNSLKPFHQGADEGTCFLPPLTAIHSPMVRIADLQIAAKAKKEYAGACSALTDKKYEVAEGHLRKAVKQDPKYPAAWVTLGQLLAAQQKTGEARDTCAQALAADANYLHAYLCLADISGREQNWDEMLKLSSRAIELDPTNDCVAYGLNAAANLNLHKLLEAEKSALKAIEIDKTHSDPRIYFLLAQIYEAKGDRTGEAEQLREYLKFANPDDSAMVKRYLSQLEGRQK
jgi:tetratricopeptide (TPR) repeat protein